MRSIIWVNSLNYFSFDVREDVIKHLGKDGWQDVGQNGLPLTGAYITNIASKLQNIGCFDLANAVNDNEAEKTYVSEADQEEAKELLT